MVHSACITIILINIEYICLNSLIRNILNTIFLFVFSTLKKSWCHKFQSKNNFDFRFHYVKKKVMFFMLFGYTYQGLKNATITIRTRFLLFFMFQLFNEGIFSKSKYL